MVARLCAQYAFVFGRFTNRPFLHTITARFRATNGRPYRLGFTHDVPSFFADSPGGLSLQETP